MVVKTKGNRGVIGARKEILEKVRRALAGAPQDNGYDTIPRDYTQTAVLKPEERIQLFEERLRDYGVDVHRCAWQKLPNVIKSVAFRRGKRSLAIPKGFTQVHLPPVLELRRDDGLAYSELNQCAGVLTFCALAIAITGTIILRHTEYEGRRALTLLPDYHLCIVREDQVVETVAEGIRAMAQWPKVPITTISGPSATSDIEMTRVQGVHGPRVLDVIIAGP